MIEPSRVDALAERLLFDDEDDRGRFASLYDDWSRALRGDRKHLVAIRNPRTAEGFALFLATLRTGHAATFIERGRDDVGRDVVERFAPNLISDGRCPCAPAIIPGRPPLHPELAVLIRTSGSTSAPRYVRLSTGNLAANGSAIAAATSRSIDEIAITSLPIDGALGLSVITAALSQGGPLFVTETPVLTAPFWDLVARRGIDTVALTPQGGRFLLRSGFTTPVRKLLLSGAPMSPRERDSLATLLTRSGGLYYMYGLAEGTARVTVLVPPDSAVHAESVGSPINGVELVIKADPEDPASGWGEIVLRGPSVMLGYASGAADLGAAGIRQEWRTGDRGKIEDGYLYVAGRTNREVKVLDRRVNLDEVEAVAHRSSGNRVAAVQHKSTGLIWIAYEGGQEVDLVELSAAIGSPKSTFRSFAVDVLPLTPSGKTDYGMVADAVDLLRPRGHRC